MMKTCKTCHGTFEMTKAHFHAASNMKCGFRSDCKECSNRRQRECVGYTPRLDSIVQPAARALSAAGYSIGYIASDLGRDREAVRLYLDGLSREKS